MANTKQEQGITLPKYETLGRGRSVLMGVCFLASLNYLVWRTGTFNPEAAAFSYIVFAAEIFGFIMMLIHYLTVWRLSVREAPVPMEGRSVDVFITTINETLDTVRRTALAALNMDYPHKVWILDDGRREEMRQMAEELGCGYITRPDNKHAKAGNLNHALTKTSGEFIAFFDADHAPKKSFLVRTLGYFADPKVSFVQTPQEFYNLDSYQHRLDRKTGKMWTEQSLFFRVIQRGKDAWNAAFFCGSCAIMRRASLDAIGGFAVGTVAEDLHTSIILHKAGWRSAYHDEALAFGIAAAQLEPFFKQRMRWGKGAMQIWRKENVLFGRGLTVMQRIFYLSSIITYFTGWQKMIFYATPAIVLWTDILPIIASGREFLIHFLPFLVLSLLAFSETSRGYGRAWYSEQYNMTSFAAWMWATAGYIKKKQRFIVTSKHISALPDYWRFLMPQMLVISFTLLGIAIGTWRYTHGMSRYGDSAFAANVFWACYGVFFAILSVRFAMGRAGFRRHDYRFHMPLVAAFRDRDGKEHHATVRDISASGMCLYLTQPGRMATGTELTGELWLPDGPLPFVAQIRTVSLAGRRFGTNFVWQEKANCYRLERFLYGTDHEWHVHNITDRTETILEYVRRLFVRPFAHTPRAAAQSMLYTTNGATAPMPGVIAIDAAKTRANVMVFSPLPSDTALETRIFTESGWKTLKARIANENKVDTGGASFYHCRLEEAFA